MPQDRTEPGRRPPTSARALRAGVQGISLVACALAGVAVFVSAMRWSHLAAVLSPWEPWVWGAVLAATVSLALTSVASVSALATDAIAGRPAVASVHHPTRIGEEK